jgi:hypothetical protein
MQMKQKQRYWLFQRGQVYYLEDSLTVANPFIGRIHPRRDRDARFQSFVQPTTHRDDPAAVVTSFMLIQLGLLPMGA